MILEWLMCVAYETKKKKGKKEATLSNEHMQGWEADFFFFFSIERLIQLRKSVANRKQRTKPSYHEECS